MCCARTAALQGGMRCPCECHAGLPAGIKALSSKTIAKTVPELSKTQPGGTQDPLKSSPEALMRAQMRPRAPNLRLKGAQKTFKKAPKLPKRRLRAPKMPPREAREAPKPL